MNTIKILIITIISFIGLKAATPIELVNSIASLDINMQYYFFVENKKAFLVKEKKDKSLALWYYTNDRKWQPIHNAGAFDGYSEAKVNLSSLLVNKNSEQITLGNITNSNINDNIKTLLQNVENKTIKIGWYFWVESNKAFLIKKISNGEISIWHYTNDRKWQPIHNAGAFDGYPKVEKTLDSVSFSTSSNTLSTGSAIGTNGVKIPPTPPGMPVIY